MSTAGHRIATLLARLGIGLLAVGVVSASVVLRTANSAEASGPRPLFQMPFPCGETWGASTYSGHNAIDWNVIGAGNSDQGRTVVASAAGNASAHSNGILGFYVVIDHGSGWQTVYAHLLENGRAIGSVSQGTAIGFVGATGLAEGAHLHWEQIADGAKQSTLYANGLAIVPAGAPDGNPYTSNNCAPGEGSFVRASGPDVYRIAGGAALKQYDCSVLGGCPGIIQITDAQLAAYPRTPSDGTFLRKAENQQIARIVAGSPVTIFDCGPLGGCPGVVNVNSLSVDDLVRAQPYPRNGAFLRRVETQVVLRMVGGTPVRLYNCGPLGGCPGIVDVNSSSVDELLNARPLPADGTFVRRVETQVVLRIAGGSPVQLFNCGPLGGCEGIVDVNSSSVDDLVNARPCPADGTVLQGLPSGQHWRISQCSRTRVGAQPAVQVDDLAVNAFACGTGAAQSQLANPNLDAASAIAVAQVAAFPIVRRRLCQRSSRRHPAREYDHKGRGLWMRRLRAALLGIAALGAFLVITGAQGCGPPPGC